MKTEINSRHFVVLYLLFVLLTGCAAPESNILEPIGTIEPTNLPTDSPTHTPVPISLTWNKKADLPTPRFGHSVGVVDGKIYAIGGGWSMNSVEMYDPITDTWSGKADMPTGRIWFSTAVVNDKIYVFGGDVGHWVDEPIASVEMYDPVTDTWAAKADMPVPRHSLATVVLDGKIHAIGGDVLSAKGDITHSGRVDIYDPLTDSWEIGNNMRIGKWADAVVIDEKIFVISRLGGVTEVFDPTRDRWYGASGIPDTSIVKSIAEYSGNIITFGGAYNATGLTASSVLVYDPKTDNWQQAEDMPFQCWAMSASEVGGKIYLIGGMADLFFKSDAEPIASVWEVTIER